MKDKFNQSQFSEMINCPQAYFLEKGDSRECIINVINLPDSLPHLCEMKVSIATSLRVAVAHKSSLYLTSRYSRHLGITHSIRKFPQSFNSAVYVDGLITEEKGPLRGFFFTESLFYKQLKSIAVSFNHLQILSVKSIYQNLYSSVNIFFVSSIFCHLSFLAPILSFCSL